MQAARIPTPLRCAWLLLFGMLLGAVTLAGCTAPASSHATWEADTGVNEPPPSGEPPLPRYSFPGVPRAFTGVWEYQFGDSPVDSDGTLRWAWPEKNGTGWRESGPFAALPGRNGNNFLWVRTRLFGPPARDPVLFLYGVDQIFQAYLDGRLIYQSGDFSSPQAMRFVGYKGHLVPLPLDYQNRHLSLRIHSNYRNIGPFGTPRLGERADLIADLFREDLQRLFVAGLMVMVGLASLALFAVRREELAYLMYGGFTLCLGIYLITQLQIRSLIFNNPLIWVYIELFSLYALATFLPAYIEQILGRGPLGTVRLLRIIHIVYIIGSAAVIASGAVEVYATLFPFQMLLFADAVFLILAILIAAFRGNIEARIFAIGFTIAAAVMVYDLLGALRLLPRTQNTMSHYGNAVFIFCLGIILLRRFLLVHKRLQDYSSVLQLSLASVQSLSEGERVQVALEEINRMLGAQCALLYLTRDGKPPASFAFGRDASGPLASSPSHIDFGLIEQVQAKRKPVIGKLTATKSLAIVGSRSRAMAAPLLFREQLVGVLYLESTGNRRSFRDDDLDVLLGLSNQVAISIVSSRTAQIEQESTRTKQRFVEQQALLDAAVRMASGDLASPIVVNTGSAMAHLAQALESMRRDLWGKLRELESRNREIQILNEELGRQIEQRSRRLMATIMQRQGGKSAPPTDLTPGKMLVGRYRVLRKLGQGAMSTVYEVEHVADGRHVAAKLLSTRADKSTLLRFAREAQILSRLHHPNLIAISDIDMTTGGVLFIVLELVRGGNLSHLRNRYGQVRWGMCVLLQTADALDAIHAAGIVHRVRNPTQVSTEKSRGMGQGNRRGIDPYSVSMRRRRAASDQHKAGLMLVHSRKNLVHFAH